MPPEPNPIAAFYASAQGAVVARLIRTRIAAIWPVLPGQSLLGIGYTGPYLRHYLPHAMRCLHLTPAQVAPACFPSDAPSLSVTADEDALPFADLSLDRILLVHGLEAADNARRLLREIWRVLKDDGRLLVVAPNRRGLWAHVEATPFGQGQPYSPGQISRLLEAGFFRVERRDTALYMPPSRLRLVLRGAPMWERAGRMLAPQLAGVTITEAVKDFYSVVPLGEASRRRVVFTQAG